MFMRANGASQQEIPSDPAIPAKDKCHNCGKQSQYLEEGGGAGKLFRCGGCKLTHYCSKKCQKEDWSEGHKTVCASLKVGKHCLPRVVQVRRDFYGGYIDNPEQLVESEFTDQASSEFNVAAAVRAMVFGTHSRLGCNSAVLLLSGHEAVWHNLIQQCVQLRLRKLIPYFSCEDIEEGSGEKCLGCDDEGRDIHSNDDDNDDVITQCPCVVKYKKPCGDYCPYICREANPLNFLSPVRGLTTQNIPLSRCAMDHRSVLEKLTPEQLTARYDTACKERWSHGGMSYMFKNRMHTVDGQEGVCILDILGDGAEPCDECGSDGPQFFSFCLNRPVNSDRVKHCDNCGKCFYFRPGLTPTCAYCGFNYDWYGENCTRRQADGSPIPRIVPKRLRGCYKPRPEDDDPDFPQSQLAAEGYWGL